MSFLHMQLVLICHSSTYIWSAYVIPPHTSGPDMSFLHMHVCIWRNDISGPDGCGRMIYPDEMDMEE
jgi:hypothetical protein